MQLIPLCSSLLVFSLNFMLLEKLVVLMNLAVLYPSVGDFTLVLLFPPLFFILLGKASL